MKNNSLPFNILLAISSLIFPQLVRANPTINSPQPIAQSQENQCPLSENWEYHTSQSLSYNNEIKDYVIIPEPYSTTIKLTEADPRQETFSNGGNSTTVTMSSITLFNNDPNVDNGVNTIGGTRIGETVSLVLAILVPFNGVEYPQSTILLGTISTDCLTIEGRIEGAGEASIPFTMTALETNNAQEETTNFTTINVTGNWVSITIDNGEYGLKHMNKITQNGDQTQFTSGISGATFEGSISGQEITLIPGEYNAIVGTLSEDGNRITSPDILLIRLGSPGCDTYETCQIP